MRKLLLLCLMVPVILNAASPFYNGVPVSLPAITNPTNVSSAPFIVGGVRSDTMIVTGSSLGSSYFSCSGVDSLHPFVVYFNNTFGAGVGIENSKYIKVIGIGTATINGGGTNGYVKGLVDYVQVSGFKNLNGFNGGWWLKLESGDACSYSTPTDYLNGVASNTVITKRLLHIWFTHNQFGNSDGTQSCGGEAIYAISTGAYGRDPVPCLGNVIYKPLWGGYFHIDSNIIYNPGRTGIQLSGCDIGYNTIMGNIIYHAGRELNSSQGAGIRNGYGTSNTTEIAYNKVYGSYIYNYDLETGCNFHDNIGDSAGYWYTTKNPQAIPSLIAYASLPNSQVVIQNNKMGLNSSSNSSNPGEVGTHYAIYGSTNYVASGNVVCGNNYKPTVLALPFNYSQTCAGPDTSCVNVTQNTTHDTLQVLRKYTLVPHKDSVLISATPRQKFNTKKYTSVTAYVWAQLPVTRYDTTGFVDSPYIVTNGASHDTVIRKCSVSMVKPNFGIFQTNLTNAQQIASARSVGANTIRRNRDYSSTAPFTSKQLLDSGFRVWQGVNDGSLTVKHPYLIDSGAYRDSVASLLNQAPVQLVCGTNEPTDTAHYSGSLVAVINQDKASSRVVHAHGAKYYNGGITSTITYAVWQDYYDRGKYDSADIVSMAIANQHTTSGSPAAFFVTAKAQYSVRVYRDTLLPAYATSVYDGVNLHWYEPINNDTTNATFSPLLSMTINYLYRMTGKLVVTNETGTYDHSLTRMQQMFAVWVTGGASEIVYFGDMGSQAAPNLSFYKMIVQSYQ